MDPARSGGERLGKQLHRQELRALTPRQVAGPFEPVKRIMKVVHLTASRFLGGPEQQMLGLARSLPAHYESTFVSFSENGLCEDLLQEVRSLGFTGIQLRRDTPRLVGAFKELVDLLRRANADILCCHGYKANLLGWLATRRLGVPVVSVSHGWTAETLRVRLYDALDRRVVRRMSKVVSVSEGQAEKVRRAGVAPNKTVVIRNAIFAERFSDPDPAHREGLASLFPTNPQFIVGAAGRLSPEKGFEILIDAAAEVVRENPQIGFVIFGDGALRESLAARIKRRCLEDSVILGGFRTDLERFVPHFDLFALSSFTEGLPVAVLEAFAGGVPVVATRVGGVPEVVDHGVNGYCIEPGCPKELARGILDALSDDTRRRTMGQNGKQRVVKEFTFEVMAKQYQRLFEDLVAPCPN